MTGCYKSTEIIILKNKNGENSSVILPITKFSKKFIIKYNKDGFVLWANTFKDTEIFNSAYFYNKSYITTDLSGCVYMTGFYSSSQIVILNNNKTLPITTGQNYYIIKYNTDGLVQWTISINGIVQPNNLSANYEIIYGSRITSDSSSVYISGSYNSLKPIILYNGNGQKSTKTLPPTQYSSPFTVKYDTNGNVIWVTSFTGIGKNSFANAIVADTKGIYTSGYYESKNIIKLNNAS